MGGRHPGQGGLASAKCEHSGAPLPPYGTRRSPRAGPSSLSCPLWLSVLLALALDPHMVGPTWNVLST